MLVELNEAIVNANKVVELRDLDENSSAIPNNQYLQAIVKTHSTFKCNRSSTTVVIII